MAKVKVRVLYPIAFEMRGVDVGDAEEVTVEADVAGDLIAQGYAEKVGGKVKTETAVVKLEADK